MIIHSNKGITCANRTFAVHLRVASDGLNTVRAKTCKLLEWFERVAFGFFDVSLIFIKNHEVVHIVY